MRDNQRRTIADRGFSEPILRLVRPGVGRVTTTVPYDSPDHIEAAEIVYDEEALDIAENEARERASAQAHRESCAYCQREDRRSFTADDIDRIRHEAAVQALEALEAGLTEAFDGVQDDHVRVPVESVRSWIRSVALGLRVHIRDDNDSHSRRV